MVPVAGAGFCASTRSHAVKTCALDVGVTTVLGLGTTSKQYRLPGLTALMVSFTPSPGPVSALGPVQLSASCETGNVTHTPPVTGSVPPAGSGWTFSMKSVTTSIVAAGSLYACT